MARQRRLRQCATCLEDRLEKEFRPPSHRCRGEYGREACKYCFRDWIQSRIGTQGTRITCPRCSSDLDYLEVKEFADSATFQRYETMVLNRILEQDPDFVWCAHGCGSGQLHPDKINRPVMYCHHCRRETCAVHMLPWHRGLNCQQFDASLAPGAGNEMLEIAAPEDDRQAGDLQRARYEAANREMRHLMIQYSDILKVFGVVIIFVGYVFLLTMAPILGPAARTFASKGYVGDVYFHIRSPRPEDVYVGE
ncbi:hypothetical protein GGR51DRAFT_577758 [Nemania sp. FL0031]|nr:hypothetical protein GGR51DRAFT_577758 [Nemania sp. FL0031]